jgi:hypothetical protein
MPGLSGSELDLRRRGIVLPYFHNEALESRSAKLAFGIPYEILLGILCNGDKNGERAADFFVSLAGEFPEPTATYLYSFITRLFNELDFDSCELEATRGFRHTPMDFPRPSPARLIVLDFAARLARSPALYESLSLHPHARTFFHYAHSNPQRA